MLIPEIVRVNGRITWRAFRSEVGSWVAVCDMLKLTAEGDTWDDLTDTVQEILTALFTSLMEEGTLVDFLASHGWSPLAPLPEAGADVRLDLPFVLTPQARPNETHPA
jgi:predicted RNase H-like HicB family nuclease